jgi:hypothetical protein
MLRGATPRAEPVPALPRGGGLLDRVVEMGRRLLGRSSGAASADARDVTFPLRLTASEAEHGGRKRVTLRRADGDDEVVVTIPAGIRGGARLRLRGKGRVLAGGARGDAYLLVEVPADRA